MELIIKVANGISCLWLAYCATLFYIVLYGNDNKVVYHWPTVQHWTLKLGLVGIITGSVFNALAWKQVGWSGALLNVGLALVFNWAYLYHKKLFIK
jgi:hypothetical protein